MPTGIRKVGNTMFPDISLLTLIYGLLKIVAIRYWVWLCGAALLVALWISKQPRKNKISLITSYGVLLIAYIFMPRHLPGYQYWNNKENKKMQEYYIFIQENNKRTFMPLSFSVKAPVNRIFQVPVKNAVGTIDLDNAITILKFCDDELKYDIVAKDFLEEVTGAFDFGFCNVYSDEEIAYTQTRWMVIANLKTGKVISPVITYELSDFIPSLQCISASERKFLLMREGPYGGKGTEDFLHISHVVDANSVTDLGSILAGVSPTGYKVPWQLHNKLIFTYDVDSNKISCHDENLKLSSHPFADVFNLNSKKFRRIKEFVLHPTLPFAIIVEKGKRIPTDKIKDLPWEMVSALAIQRDIHALYLLRWDTSEEKNQLTPLLSDTHSLIPPVFIKKYSHFEFSPDGSWLVFRDESKSEERPVFIALPVDPGAPLFLGEPLYLGRLKKGRQPTTTTWTTDPLGFVVAADDYLIWKWDLGMTKEARVLRPGRNIVATE